MIEVRLSRVCLPLTDRYPGDGKGLPPRASPLPGGDGTGPSENIRRTVTRKGGELSWQKYGFGMKS